MTRALFLFVAAIFMVAGDASDAFSQSTPRRVFVEAGFGAGTYTGERGPQGGVSGVYWLRDSFGAGLHVGAGYRLMQSIDLVGSFSAGTYPSISRNKDKLNHIIASRTEESRSSFVIEARYRMLAFGQYEPWIGAGLGRAHGTINGKTKSGKAAFLGLGISRPIGRFNVFTQIRQQFVSPNQVLDLAGPGRSPDVLTNFSLGLRYHLRKRPPRLGTVVISGPGFLKAGEEGEFSIGTSLDPVDYSVTWTFSDGTQMNGYAVRHAFAGAGEYEISARVENSRQAVDIVTTVSVERRLEPISITVVTQTPMSPVTGSAVEYRPVIRGNPVECFWDFGDGSVANECETSHVFEDPGAYQVVLTATNDEYSDSAQRETTVKTDVCSAFPSLTSVYFGASSSDLSLEMRQLLRDNFSAAATCPDRILSITGFALSSEQNADELAQRRAEAVMQYYMNLGISSSKVDLGQTSVQDSVSDSELEWTGRRTETTLIKR